MSRRGALHPLIVKRRRAQLQLARALYRHHDAEAACHRRWPRRKPKLWPQDGD